MVAVAYERVRAAMERQAAGVIDDCWIELDAEIARLTAPGPNGAPSKLEAIYSQHACYNTRSRALWELGARRIGERFKSLGQKWIEYWPACGDSMVIFTLKASAHRGDLYRAPAAWREVRVAVRASSAPPVQLRAAGEEKREGRKWDMLKGKKA